MQLGESVSSPVDDGIVINVIRRDTISTAGLP